MGDERTGLSAALMADFAETTGLAAGAGAPRRYLWTDAFAVCTFLELYQRTDDASWRDLALRLVGQVHHILGRHRPDDPRRGWISGLDDGEGERHPTAGGLRIGKALPERPAGEPYDDRLEWDRDGQYFHYLTKWMHALERVARLTGDGASLRCALELAKAAHARFTFLQRFGGRALHWKMSIDLTRPLVPSMGQHDPIDGLVTCCELQAAAETGGISLPCLDAEIEDLAAISRGIGLATGDPLGIGGLLFDACRIVQLTSQGKFRKTGVLEEVMDAALAGLRSYRAEDSVQLSPRYRLPFRELGLAIGLHGVEEMQNRVDAGPEHFTEAIRKRLEGLSEYVGLQETIERFWLDDAHREGETWREHRDINSVMLATSLAPGCFLTV